MLSIAEVWQVVNYNVLDFIGTYLAGSVGVGNNWVDCTACSLQDSGGCRDWV